MKLKLFFFCISIFFLGINMIQAQTIKPFVVKGYVYDDNEIPLKNASINILNKLIGTTTDSLGFFKISINTKLSFSLVISHTGFATIRKRITPNTNGEDSITVSLEKDIKTLSDVVVTDNRERREVGRISIDASKSLVNPSPISGIESLIKTIVGSNNELTSQYSVRGGSYDENLVYVNDFEVFRPYLVSNAQQEGLSFINPQMTGNVKFYNGGFAAKYGDTP